MQNATNGLEKVAWLGKAVPPMAISSYMRQHGIELVAPAHGEPVPPPRLITLDGVAHDADLERSAGACVAVVHTDVAAADQIANVLRSHAARVVTLRPEDSLECLHALVPDAVLIDAADWHRSCWQLVRSLWRHPGLRFVPLLLTPPGSLRTASSRVWDLPGIDAGLHFVRSDYQRLTASVREHPQVSLRLDQLGAARMLSALMDSERSLRIRVDTQAHTFLIDVVGPLVIGALGGPRDALSASNQSAAAWAGPVALGALLSCNEGAVSVQESERVDLTNIMSPLPAALHAAMMADLPQAIAASAPSSFAEPPASLPDWAEASSEAHPRERHDRTLLGVASAGHDSAAPSSSAAIRRRAPRARRRDDRTLAGIGRALHRPTPQQPSSQPGGDQSFPHRRSSTPPAPSVASNTDASERAVRRALDATLVGIGGAKLLNSGPEEPKPTLLDAVVAAPCLEEPMPTLVSAENGHPAVPSTSPSELSMSELVPPRSGLRPAYLLAACLLALTALVVLVLSYSRPRAAPQRALAPSDQTTTAIMPSRNELGAPRRPSAAAVEAPRRSVKAPPARRRRAVAPAPPRRRR